MARSQPASPSVFTSHSVARMGASAFAVMAFAIPASAQSPSELGSQAVARSNGPSKYAGTYHTATGTWSRGFPQAAFGPDVVYSNTALSGYFATAGGTGGFGAGATNFDEGGLPGLSNGDTFAVGPNRDSYNINGFEIAYCDFGAPGTSGWEIQFYESYTPCSTAFVAPDASIQLTGLPAGGGCWVFDVDLTGGMEFTLTADGDGAWDDDSNADSFGWSYRYIGSDGLQPAGFQLAGDPLSTDPGYATGGGFGTAAAPREGTATYYGATSLCDGTGSGYLTQDFWWLEDPTNPTTTGCYFFGGYRNIGLCDGQANPFASFYMEMRAEALGEGNSFGTVYCTSNPNSTGATTSIELIGFDTASDDRVFMSAGNLPVGNFGYFITSPETGFAANPGGSAGNLCLAGNIGRFANPGQIKAAGADGTISLDTTIGEWSLTELPSALPPLSYAAMAGMTSNFQLWHRDSGMDAPTSNFSDGIGVTWN